MADSTRSKGTSLVKGPAALLGLAALVYGVSGLIFGGDSFSVDIPDGTVTGETWLGLELNGWSSLLFAGGGALLLFGAPLHWGAKTLALIVGLAFGAASVIALVDGDDVLGIAAANGLTKLVWGAASAVLLVLALLPRVGGDRGDDDASRTRSRRREPAPADERPAARADQA